MEAIAEINVEMIVDDPSTAPVVSHLTVSIVPPPTVPIVPQKKGKRAPGTPPKKRKRTTPLDACSNSGNTGRETSEIWDHFTKFKDKAGKCRARCNYCIRKTFASESKTHGTSTLWKHLNVLCHKSPFRFIDIKQPTLDLKPIKEGGQETGKGSVERVVYNVDDIRRAIAEFVIMDEQPFKVVEGEGFKRLMAKALPNFVLPSRVTVARHCLKIYKEEKDKLKTIIKNQRVCLTSDTWTSLQNLTYMVVTAHWIDDEWNLKKKILNFFQSPNHKGETIAKGIEACLLDWGIENLFTVTLDNANANDSAIKHLKARIDDWEGVILKNEFLHIRCNAHILNLIVKDGLDEQIEPISRVRNAVKYVKSSTSRFASFKSYVEKVKIDTHGLLSLDVETRWNSTYTMLDTAVKFEKAYARMYVDDQKYKKYCEDIRGIKGHPTVDDWKIIRAFIKFLNIFYHTTLKFSGSLYVTSNLFFHEFFNVRNAILKYSYSDDLILVDMAERMKSKFDKYWGKFDSLNMLLFIAVVLDPRYKMKYVSFSLIKTYDSLLGRLMSEKILGVLTRLYDYYNGSKSETCSNIRGDVTSMASEVGDMQSQWEQHWEQEENMEKKSELDKYLMDDVEETKDLNILAWWKYSSSRYPIVSKMARDVLSVPVSTVASESAFSTGGRILDSYRSSLSPMTVEALICTQQWIRSPSKEFKLPDMLEEIEKIEQAEEEYPGAPLSID